jgi:hypothetical protein
MKRVAGLLAFGLTWGCGSSDDGGKTPGDDAIDVRVSIPESDPAFLDLVAPEVVIESGEDFMYCAYLENDGAEFAIDLMESHQGKYGHHMVLLTTLEPKPAGTFESCTDASEMWKYRSFVLPDTELPEGHGIKVPTGMQYVMQFHYVNTAERAIRVRDVARLRKIDPSTVTTWTSTLTTNSIDFEVPPKQESSVSFDCALPKDVNLLLVGGHMHELGKKIEISFGPSADALENLYLVDPWDPTYRDAPPITMLFDSPMALKAGTVVRTKCTWDNPNAHDMNFPHEMCSAFGYIAGSEEPFHCDPSAKAP